MPDLTREDFEQWIERVCRDVAELPDRTSPGYDGDMMLVTAQELATIMRGAFEDFAEAEAGYDATFSAAPPPPTDDGWLPIETAPKDGNDILAFSKELNCYLVIVFDDEAPDPKYPWLTADGPPLPHERIFTVAPASPRCPARRREAMMPSERARAAVTEYIGQAPGSYADQVLIGLIAAAITAAVEAERQECMRDVGHCPSLDDNRYVCTKDAAIAAIRARGAAGRRPMSEAIKEAIAVAVERFADCGPGDWWFVHHPDGYLIECGDRKKAEQIAKEINAGRAALKGQGQ